MNEVMPHFCAAARLLKGEFVFDIRLLESRDRPLPRLGAFSLALFVNIYEAERDEASFPPSGGCCCCTPPCLQPRISLYPPAECRRNVLSPLVFTFQTFRASQLRAIALSLTTESSFGGTF